MSSRIIPIVPKTNAPSKVLSNFSFNDYLGLHLNFYQSLLIQITLACPLECDHCCVDARPNRREKLDIGNLEKGIINFSSLPSARLVCITGGEPFSAKALLRKSLLLCEALSLKSYVISSAHWATSLKSARNILSALPPISLLSISTDRYHEKFVPLKNVRNALQAANELGIQTNLLLTISKDDGDFEDKLATELEDIWCSVDVHRTPLGAVGRSIEQFEYHEDFSFDDRPCPLMGTPAVTADGSVFACCQVRETNLMSQTDHALNIGHFGVDTFESMQYKLKSDPLLRAIRLVGPKWILRKAFDRGILPDLPLNDLSLCHACSYTVRDSHISIALREMLRAPEIAIQINYLDLVNNEN